MYSGYRTERRKFQRLRVNLSVLYHIEGPDYVRRVLDNREYEGNTIDLSEGGVALLVGHYLPPETKLFMEFIVFESDPTGEVDFYEPLTVSGEVRSTVPMGNCEYRLCICFEGVGEYKRNKLFDLTHSFLKPVGNC